MSFAGLLANYTSQTTDEQENMQKEIATNAALKIAGGKISEDGRSLMLAHKLLPSLNAQV